jgi:magnesium transporter
METDFEKNTRLINYGPEGYSNRQFSLKSDLLLSKGDRSINWVNTYGLGHTKEIRKLVLENGMDDFLLRLLQNHGMGNKVIQLEEQLFVAAKIIKTEDRNLRSEQMFFVAAKDFVWCIQEKKGDHFDWIRQRIFDDKGIIRKKRADYLLFFILETLVGNHMEKYAQRIQMDRTMEVILKQEPTPGFVLEVERKKALINEFKKAVLGLRDIAIKLERVEIRGFQTKYFSELKEQINGLINDIDSDIHELESQINLFFSIQGHRLNQVINTLTIISVIFIPLTFLAAIYGMNFDRMPELHWPNGYFILWGLMVAIALICVLVFKRKGWF